MKKNTLFCFFTVMCLCAALISALSGCMGIVNPIEATRGPSFSPAPEDTPSPDDPSALEMRAFGISESGAVGRVKCEFAAQGEFVYRFSADEPSFSAGDKPEGYSPVPQNGIVEDDACRGLSVLELDSDKQVLRFAYFDYIPGIRYFSSSDAGYAALLKTVTNTDKSDYSFGYGQLSLEYLDAAPGYQGVNAGINYFCHADEPFLSPVSGTVTAASKDAVSIYVPDRDLTLTVLHLAQFEQAASFMESGATVQAGELLGYTGNAGPSGFPEIHLELLQGRRSDYAGYSNSADTVRRITLDPRLLFDGRDAVNTADGPSYVPYSVNAGGTAGYGLAARENDTVYYLNPADGYRIWSMKNDGTQAVRVTKDKAKFITVCEGWLYYCAPAAGLHFYKCRTDGSERTLLYKTSMSAFTVVGDLIYMETVSSSQRLHVLKTDGTGYNRISDQKVMSPFYYRGALYSCAVRHSKQLYAAYPNSDGEGYTYKKTGNLRATSIVIYNDTVYYANSADSDRLYAADIDGGNARKIADITVADINICNGYLYFSNVNDYSCIYSCRLDGSELEKLGSRAYCGDLCIAGDWLFYTVNTSSQTIYRVDLRTGNQKKLA